jgi:hypothetical protein
MIAVQLKKIFNNSSLMDKKRLTKIYAACAVTMAALISLFLPSSIDGVIYPQSTLWACFACIIILSGTLGLKKWQLTNSSNALFIIILFLIFTIFSPFSYIAWGGLAPYLLLLTILQSDIKHIGHGKELIVILVIVNVILLFFGYGAIFNNEYIFHISENYYQAYSEGLFESMNIWSSKPVTVFATHSISAFVYFAFLCLNLRVAGSPLLPPMAKRLFFISGIGYLCLIPFLMSSTSIVVFLVAIPITSAFLFRNTSRRYKKIFIFTYTTFLAILLYLIAIEFDILAIISDTLSSQGGGFLGRYTAGNSEGGGRMQGTYDFLMKNYFQPIGFTFSDSIALGDTFIAEYILKISIIGYGLIYLMLFKWLQWNVLDKKSRVMIFLFFLISDIGYPLLPYYRVIGFLPFFIVLWNSVSLNARAIDACPRLLR